MFDAFTFQNLIMCLDESNGIVDFKVILKKFCEDMGIDTEGKDDNFMAYQLLMTLSSKLDIGVIEGMTECSECGSTNCRTTIDLNLMRYDDTPVILETEQFILSFKRNFVERDMDAIEYIAESMNEIIVKSTGEKHKIKDIENDDDIDNILTFLTGEELDRITDEILQGGVIIYSTDKCLDCQYSSSYGTFNIEDIAKLLIQGYLDYEQ